MNTKVVPQGYTIIDGLIDVHDGDVTDGRYGLYRGNPNTDDDFEFLGCSHDYDLTVMQAEAHKKATLVS